MLAKMIFASWKSPVITREKLEEITGGMLKARTLANLDCQGKGIKGGTRIGQKTLVYPVENVIAFLDDKISRYSSQSYDKQSSEEAHGQ
jgi:hypothetical protein